VSEGVVRFALVGCGDIGAHNARALDDADGAQLTTIFDPIPALAKNLAHRHSATAVDSLTAAVCSPDVDAVLAATPHDTHEEIVRAALDAGKHVLVEKPLAADLNGAVRIVRMAEASSSLVGVLFPLRSDRRFLRAVEAIESSPEEGFGGAAGTYLSFKPEHYFTGGYSKRAPSSWRQSKARAGGGVLIMNVLHHLDAVRALIGREAETVVARTVPSSVYPEIEDVASVIVDFGGVIATFVGGGSVFDGPGERIELWNPSLRVTVLPDGMVAHADGRRSVETDAVPLLRTQSRADFISGFAHAVSEGRQPEVAVRDALAVQAIVAAAYVSAAEDRIVSIADVLHEAELTSTAQGGVRALAERALAAVNGGLDGAVQVIGDGPLAEQVERLLPADRGSGRPRAVIETTGSEANVRRAISDVETLGTVVLAAPVDAELIEVAGYADIHVRGLTVVGLSAPEETEATQPRG
jgi:predicted dehydrogenase